MKTLWTALTLGILAVLLNGCSRSPDSAIAPASNKMNYEVWVIDQSDSPGMNHGGTLYIFHRDPLRQPTPSDAQPSDVIDLGEETAQLCREQTGANPVRPHMILFNEGGSHAMVAFVASGHVVMLDAAARKPVACLRASRAPGGQQAHAAFPSPDGSYVLVANQNGKRLERIDTDFSRNSFVHNTEATLDLATCTTPSGKPCEAEGLRPDNAPICPSLSDDGKLAFVTLRGGGLLVVDPTLTPMQIVAEYDLDTIKGNGCGGVQVGAQMYINSGGRPGHMDHLQLFGFDVYRFPLSAFETDASRFPPNQPAPVTVHSSTGEHDSHGMVATGTDRYIWVMDRHADLIEVFASDDDRHLRSIPLNGEFTDNAAPDLTDISPDGERVYIALRGPTPLSGDPHIATGASPGMAIVEVLNDGADGRVIGLIRLSNIGEDGVERADPHGLRLRPLP